MQRRGRSAVNLDVVFLMSLQYLSLADILVRIWLRISSSQLAISRSFTISSFARSS